MNQDEREMVVEKLIEKFKIELQSHEMTLKSLKAEAESIISGLRTRIWVLCGMLLLVVLFVLFSPVEVKVGDVCLSCWGN